MKRWLAVVIGSMGLVALWALPPSAFETPARNASPEAIHLESVEREVGRLHAALRTARWSDSLSQLAVRSAEDGLAMGGPQGSGVDEEAVRAWEEAQRVALAAHPRRDPEMVVGVFWQPLNHGALPDVPTIARGDEVTFVGTRDGRPYCLRAIPYIRPDVRVWSRSGADLGPCRLYAAYGIPGAELRAWLDASALGFARVHVPGWAAEVAGTAPPRSDGTMRLFGVWRPPLARYGLPVQACLAGRATACGRAVSDLELVMPRWGDRGWLAANTPASSYGSQMPDAPFGYLDDALLYEWEAEFGSEAFARFWTSGEPMPEAFETAFGVPLGEWVLGWVGQHAELYRAGPSLPWSSVWTSVLVLAGLAGVATVAGVRRRVG